MSGHFMCGVSSSSPHLIQKNTEMSSRVLIINVEVKRISLEWGARFFILLIMAKDTNLLVFYLYIYENKVRFLIKVDFYRDLKTYLIFIYVTYFYG